MSLVDEEIASVGVGDDGDDDDEEEEGSDGSHVRCKCSEEHTKKQKGFSGGGLSINFGKAKQVVLQPFTRSKKQLPRKNKTRASSSSCAFSSGKRFGGGVNGGGNNKGCYFCFKQPPTLDSPIGSQTSDPEHPNFTFEILRAFVEKNEFYTRECNPHLDIDVSSQWRSNH